MKIIDLRFNQDLDNKICKKLNEIARNKISEFHDLISKISNEIILELYSL